MSATARPGERQTLSWFVFGLMVSVTFVGILSELVPSGILPQMTEGLGASESRVGFLVGVYALASAIFTIPLISATLGLNRKTLLLALLAGFAVSNIVVAISSSYAVIVAVRVLGGICAGVMWPMIAAYGTRLVPEHMHGKAITFVMSGNTLGISVGLPVVTTVGITFGWRAVFMALGVAVVVIAVLAHFVLPSVEGEPLSKSNSPLAVVRNPSILLVLLLTFLSVAAHYGIYTYITLLVEMIAFAGGIGLALLIFGIGSIISVIASARYIDAHLRALIIVMLAIGGLAMAMFLAFGGTVGISHAAFFLWGLAFGPLAAVTALGMLSTKSRTPKREEITLPNAVVVGAGVRNLSRPVGAEGVLLHARVSAGCGTPWRQVEALLLLAASRTPGLRADPPPPEHWWIAPAVRPGQGDGTPAPAAGG